MKAEKNQKKECILKFEDMILNKKNSHAVSLLVKLYEKDKSILKSLSQSSILREMVTLTDHIYILFMPLHKDPFFFWNCIDPDYLVILNKYPNYKPLKEYINVTEDEKSKKKIPIFPLTELKYFSELYTEGKHSLSQILNKLIKTSTVSANTRSFWARMAAENGINDGCVIAADSCFRLHEPKSKTPRIQIIAQGSFLYYASCIKTGSKFNIEMQKNIFFHSGQIFYPGDWINKSKSLYFWQRAADYGHSMAQFNIAYQAFLEGGEQNMHKALKYSKMAADNGLKDAQAFYGTLTKDGKAGEINLVETRKHYKKVADQKDPKGQYNYALMLYRGDGGAKNLPEARKRFKMAAEQGHAMAQSNYASMCLNGEGGPIDLHEARKYLKILAGQGGDEEASYKYACMCLFEEGGPTNFEDARHYLKIAADLGHDDAQYKLACLYNNGQGGPKNSEDAKKYFKMAADKGHVNAQYIYGGILLDEGETTEARKYLKMAAEQGHAEAQHYYARMLQQGAGGSADLKEARRIMKLAADKNQADAQYYFASMCYYGEGGPVDYNLARHYLMMAAEGNHADSLYKLGCICYEGKGAPYNLEDAIKYSKMAAEQGHLYAQSNYAFFCSKKEDEQSQKEAFKYAKIAADKGFAMAQLNYGNLLREKTTDTQALVEAIRYFKMAADQGEIEAFISFHALSFQLNIFDKIKDSGLKEQMHEKEDSDSEIEITLSALEDESQDEGEEDIALSQELQQLYKEHEQENNEQRAKKQGQKEAAAQTRQILTLKKQDYDVTSMTFELKMVAGQTEKSKVHDDTLELIKSIFGKGMKSLHTFTNLEAQKAFADIGCVVMPGNGENSTLVSFDLGVGRIMKLKYHNPHGHDGEHLYNALKRYLKRFLVSINKTPETLEAK